jgi:hypothetical protein
VGNVAVIASVSEAIQAAVRSGCFDLRIIGELYIWTGKPNEGTNSPIADITRMFNEYKILRGWRWRDRKPPQALWFPAAILCRIVGMWQALKQAFINFWNPTPESQAAMKLPTLEARFKAGWKASWRWPVIWRRLVVMFVAIQLWNVGYLAVRGFQTVALERQERAEAAYALEQAARVAWAAQPGTAQDSQARQKMKKALSRLAVSANMPLVLFLGEVTHVQVNPFDQFDDDAGLGEFCKRLDLNRCEHADAAIHRARLNMGALYCQLVLPCWDDLSPTPPAQ